jgi:hypothetical protein
MELPFLALLLASLSSVLRLPDLDSRAELLERDAALGFDLRSSLVRRATRSSRDSPSLLVGGRFAFIFASCSSLVRWATRSSRDSLSLLVGGRFAFIFASFSFLVRRVMRSLCSSFSLIGDKIDPSNGRVRTKIDVLLKSMALSLLWV